MSKNANPNPSVDIKLKKMVRELKRLVNLDGVIIDCNQAYAEKLGYTVDEIIGMSVEQHTPVSDIPKMKKEFETWLKTKKSMTTNIGILTKDGTVVDTFESIENHVNSMGKVTGMSVSLMDVKELKEFQNYVMIRKFESLYENSPDLYRTVNYNGTIVDCNKTYVRELGYGDKSEVVGRNLLEHTSDKSTDALRINMAKWRHTGSSKTSEIWMKRKDGTEFPSILTPTNIYDDDGNLIGRNVVIKNATKLYETKQALDEQERIDKMKEEFLSIVTHELKSPLTPIIGLSQALIRPKIMGELNEKQHDAVSTILSNSIRLKKLIGDLLDAHKLELDKMRLDLQEISVNKLLDHIHKSFKLTAEEKNISIDCLVADSDEIKMFTDTDRVEQVISNMVYNAVDFIPKDTGKVTVTATRQDNNVMFSVRDNGIGIPLAKQKQLFTKFYQVKSSQDRKHGGTGLGLSICKGIVEKLGGSIGVDSTEGHGSNFYFILPERTIIHEDTAS